MASVNKASPTTASRRASASLAALLNDAVGAAVAVERPPSGELMLRHEGRTAVLVPLWAGAGWPTDVDRLRRSQAWESAAVHGVPVVVGQKLSSTVRESLSRGGVAWADETGSAAIDVPGLLIRLGDRVKSVDPRARRDPLEVRWSPAAGLLAEALLEPIAGSASPERTELPKIAELAAQTGVSGAFISRTLRGFDAMGWTAKSGGERGATTVRELVDPGSLLSAWARWYPGSRPQGIAAHALIRDSTAWLADVARSWPQGSWAVTGGTALERRAPFLTAVPVIELYVAEDVCVDRGRRLEAFTAVGLREVDSGARVVVFPASRAALGLMERSPWWTPESPEVGSIRLYGDILASQTVRSDEAADHLRRTRIGF